jgi:hypothetical protein
MSIIARGRYPRNICIDLQALQKPKWMESLFRLSEKREIYSILYCYEHSGKHSSVRQSQGMQFKECFFCIFGSIRCVDDDEVEGSRRRPSTTIACVSKLPHHWNKNYEKCPCQHHLSEASASLQGAMRSLYNYCTQFIKRRPRLTHALTLLNLVLICNVNHRHFIT